MFLTRYRKRQLWTYGWVGLLMLIAYRIFGPFLDSLTGVPVERSAVHDEKIPGLRRPIPKLPPKPLPGIEIAARENEDRDAPEAHQVAKPIEAAKPKFDEIKLASMKVPLAVRNRSATYAEIYQNHYSKYGYDVCRNETDDQFWLRLAVDTDCNALANQLAKPATPSNNLPTDEQLKEFSMQQYAEMFQWSLNGAETFEKGILPVPVWKPAQIIQQIQLARHKSMELGSNFVEIFYLYEALKHHRNRIEGTTGLIFNPNVQPWLESIALASKATKVISIGPGSSEDPRIHRISIEKFASDWRKFSENLDFAIADSIVEHLGFGGPLFHGENANLDISLVQFLTCVIKPHGLLFLGIPLGLDLVHFGSHRVYGPIRLPMLTANWDVLGIYRPDKISARWDWIRSDGDHNVMLVLENVKGENCD